MMILEQRREAKMPNLDSNEKPSPPRRPNFRRRKFLIDRRGQLLATAKVAGMALTFLILLNVFFFLWNALETQAIVASNPHLTEQMETIDRNTSLLLAAVSLLVLATIVVRSIMLTHRTAGAAFNLRRCLNLVASGDYDTRFRLRAKDNLRQLQDPFNLMTQSLRDRAVEDHQMLEDLATKIEELGHSELAKEVREQAEARAQLIDPPTEAE